MIGRRELDEYILLTKQLDNDNYCRYFNARCLNEATFIVYARQASLAS